VDVRIEILYDNDYSTLCFMAVYTLAWLRRELGFGIEPRVQTAEDTVGTIQTAIPVPPPASGLLTTPASAFRRVFRNRRKNLMPEDGFLA
jgi:hypothetical protein